jgi:hypothetical protein
MLPFTRAPRFQTFINLHFGEGGVDAKDHFFARFLSPLGLRQQRLFPALGAVNIAGTGLGARIGTAAPNGMLGVVCKIIKRPIQIRVP